MTSGLGQPGLPLQLEVEMADVTAAEAGGPPLFAPAAIINQPNSFTLNSSFTIKGQVAPVLDGEVFNVQHHLQRLEDGLNFRLLGGSVTASVAGGQIVMPYTSVQFTTGPNGSGAQLEIPSGETEGTFRVLTQLIAQNPNVRSVVAAFHDGLLLYVI